MGWILSEIFPSETFLRDAASAYCWWKKSCTIWVLQDLVNFMGSTPNLNWWTPDFWTINSIRAIVSCPFQASLFDSKGNVLVRTGFLKVAEGCMLQMCFQCCTQNEFFKNSKGKDWKDTEKHRLQTICWFHLRILKFWRNLSINLIVSVECYVHESHFVGWLCFHRFCLDIQPAKSRKFDKLTFNRL